MRVWGLEGHQEYDFVALIEEREDNEGLSVTNNAVAIANAVYLMLTPPHTDPARVAFYERYPLVSPEQADQVTFPLSNIVGGFAGYTRQAVWTHGTLADLVVMLGVTLAEES